MKRNLDLEIIKQKDYFHLEVTVRIYYTNFQVYYMILKFR